MSSSSVTPAYTNGVSNRTTHASTRHLFGLVYLGVILHLIITLTYLAYRIRLHAIHEFGPIIHEFDPWFNYRATQYLYEHGWTKFFSWFDYKVWYPLGRPVGTTIYPGMQFTAVLLKRFVFRNSMSLNDVCCYIPAWFGALSSIFTGLLAYECTRNEYEGGTLMGYWVDLMHEFRPTVKRKKLSRGFRRKQPQISRASTSAKVLAVISSPTKPRLHSYSPAIESGVASMAIMTILPAHLMRSAGGAYDNEAVALPAMILTFYLWCRALRPSDPHSHQFGLLAGLSYFYMVASWGGYIFVLNLIGCHAALLFFFGGRWKDDKIYLAYTNFYVVGTILAVQVPVVGLAPLKSLEQLGPLLIFVAFQLVALLLYITKRCRLTSVQADRATWVIFFFALTISMALVQNARPEFFLPLTNRVQSLLFNSSKTGNPLVDSVAEHQPASRQAYYQLLHYTCYIAPLGFLSLQWNFGDAPSFLMLYLFVAYFFSLKMVRLIVLLGPIVSVFGGMFTGRMFTWSLKQFMPDVTAGEFILDVDGKLATKENVRMISSSICHPSNSNGNSKKHVANGTCGDYSVGSVNYNGGQNGMHIHKKNGLQGTCPQFYINGKSLSSSSDLSFVHHFMSILCNVLNSRTAKKVVSVVYLVSLVIASMRFSKFSWKMSHLLSNPTIVQKVRTRDGQSVVINDYLDAYTWLRDNTEEDARILAWWDYGYQITGISNRTTFADGNTWNHEHISLLGLIFTLAEKEGHNIARHVGDYVLLWTGGGADDLAKSPHLARIAASVYTDHCPNNDPTCAAFGFVNKSQSEPSDMMKESLLYRLHSNNVRSGVKADSDLFKEVYTSRYGKVRIYRILNVSQESKDWGADPANRLCDVEGGWFCRGQYPPQLQDLLKQRKTKLRKEKTPQRPPTKLPKKKENISSLSVEELVKKSAEFGIAQRIGGTTLEVERTTAAVDAMITYMATEVRIPPPAEPTEDNLSASIRVSCQNERDLCAFWASLGHCDINPWMTFHCAPACKTCHLTNGDSGYFRKLKRKAKVYGRSQKLEGSDDEKYLTHKAMLDMIDYMENEVFAVEYVHKFKPPMREKCRNHNELCAFWAATGNCDLSPDYMTAMCSPMCKTCHLMVVDE